MKQLTLKNSGMLNIKKMYVVFLNGEPTVIYYDKDKCFDLFKSSEVKENEEIKNKEPFKNYLVHTLHETNTGNVKFKFDFDLYKEKINREAQEQARA